MKFLRIGKLLLLLSFIWLFVLAMPSIKIKQEDQDFDYYILDTAKSKIHWNCAHFGLLKFKKGTILLQKELPIEVNFTIDMESITNTDIDNKLLQGTLQNVLKSIEFFNTKVYPEAYFESHSIDKISKNNYKITGDFTIVDIGICNDFKGTIELKNDSLYFNTKTIILNRIHWGIFYGSANNPNPKEEEEGFVVTDTILLDAHIQAYLKSE